MVAVRHLPRYEPLAVAVRSGVVESVHLGAVVALGADGRAVLEVGDVDAQVFARSSLKPLQAVAMVRAGLDVDDDLLALACASHDGTPEHVDGVRRLLDSAGLDEGSLQNTPDLPLSSTASLARRCAGGGPTRLTQNCSGKHAAMLATCVAAGWPTDTYLQAEHPLQRNVIGVVEELTGDSVAHVAVDGCGAPQPSCTLRGLARAFARVASAVEGAEQRVADAVRAHPRMLGGDDRDVTALVAGVPGLVAKDGAEGVYAAALPDGRAVALKVGDGSQRPRPVVMAEALRRMGVDAPVLAEVGDVPVMGHGHRVGAVEVAF